MKFTRKNIYKTAFRIALVLLACTLAMASCVFGGEGDGVVEGVKMTAKIIAVNDKIEVEVIEGEYGASGIYWVITTPTTSYFGKDGSPALRASLKEGDVVEIVYSGQVMLSYPPQITALCIKKK